LLVFEIKLQVKISDGTKARRRAPGNPLAMRLDQLHKFIVSSEP